MLTWTKTHKPDLGNSPRSVISSYKHQIYDFHSFVLFCIILLFHRSTLDFNQFNEKQWGFLFEYYTLIFFTHLAHKTIFVY